jgi:general secretion pathway protein G
MTRARGFTLIEVLITATIVATLATIALPLSEVAIQRGKETDLRRALRDIRDALDAYKRAADEGRILRSPDQSGFPPTLATLVEGVPDAKSPSGGKIYFLRRVPRDPLNPDATAAPDKSWGIRSYDSPPEEPKPGKDVFDVYSLSTRTGLNSVPYKEW